MRKLLIGMCRQLRLLAIHSLQLWTGAGLGSRPLDSLRGPCKDCRQAIAASAITIPAVGAAADSQIYPH